MSIGFHSSGGSRRKSISLTVSRSYLYSLTQKWSFLQFQACRIASSTLSLPLCLSVCLSVCLSLSHTHTHKHTHSHPWLLSHPFIRYYIEPSWMIQDYLSLQILYPLAVILFSDNCIHLLISFRDFSINFRIQSKVLPQRFLPRSLHFHP